MSNVAFASASASANNNTPEALQIPATINWGAMTGGEIYGKLHEKRNHCQPYSLKRNRKGLLSGKCWGQARYRQDRPEKIFP